FRWLCSQPQMVIENPLLLYREKFFDVNDDLRTVQEWKATDFEVFYGSTVNMCTRRKQHTGIIHRIQSSLGIDAVTIHFRSALKKSSKVKASSMFTEGIAD